MTIHVDVCTFLRNSASIILDCDHLRDESFIGTPCYIRAMAQAVKLYSKLNRPAKDRTGENRTSRLLWHSVEVQKRVSELDMVAYSE